jgi:hypothetical protein
VGSGVSMFLHALKFPRSVRAIVLYSSVRLLSQNILNSHISRPVMKLGMSDAEPAAGLQTRTVAAGF